MRLNSLAFAGYRSFSARSPAAPDRPLERLRLAPLTILIGKNNSGKSTAARLCHHVLLALGAEGNGPFPMKGPRVVYGRSFRDIQHAGNFFNPVDVEIEFTSAHNIDGTLVAQLNQLGELADDGPAAVQTLIFNGQSCPVVGQPRGLLPDVKAAESLRREAQELLNGSCHLLPVRNSILSSYAVQRDLSITLSESTEQLAQMLNTDSELRDAVGKWTAANLDGWRVDVRQNLDLLQLVARRGGRESNLAYSGQGIQQVLPVVAVCCGRGLRRGPMPFLDIIEQPELHLHDAAHAPLGDLLLSATCEGQGRILVETHSESLVLRVRRRVAEGLNPNQVAIVYVEDTGDGSRLRHITLNQEGEADWWPEGVFSESFLEVKAIRKAQRRKAES